MSPFGAMAIPRNRSGVLPFLRFTTRLSATTKARNPGGRLIAPSSGSAAGRAARETATQETNNTPRRRRGEESMGETETGVIKRPRKRVFVPAVLQDAGRTARFGSATARSFGMGDVSRVTLFYVTLGI